MKLPPRPDQSSGSREPCPNSSTSRTSATRTSPVGTICWGSFARRWAGASRPPSPKPFHGLGGVGKTQLALEYAYRYASEYSLIWWLRSEGSESLNAGFEALGKKLGVVPEEGRAEQSEVVEAVRAALEHRTDWLLVFDNARRPDEIRPYLPRGSAGHVIVTSRYSAWGGVAKPLPVKVWEPEESVRFLLARTGQTDETTAGELSEELGRLPLALEQAAAYVEKTGRTLAGYLELFRQRKLELLQAGAPGSDENATVTTTWEISFQEIAEEHPAAAGLMNLCAFLAPDDIPLRIIVDGAEHLPDELAVAVEDPLELDKAVMALRDYSLVEVGGETPEERGLSIHRLVQAVTRERLSEEEQKTWAGAAVSVVNDAFPGEAYDVRNWPRCAQLAAHAVQAAGHAEGCTVALEAASRLLNQLGVYSQGRAELTQAKGYYERALAIAEKVYGPEHPEVAIRANNIGQILQDQGDLAEALKYTQRALAIDEKALGPEQPQVAIFANNIGTILQAQGDLAGALEYMKRALAIGEKVHGPEHPDVAIRANNIGQILQDQGDLAGALEYAKRALAIGEKVYGPEHPQVAIFASNIGTILQAQGDLAGALEYTKRALAISEKVYGPEHPQVAIFANNIGQILQDKGDLAGALEYAKRALTIGEKVYGPEHPAVAIRANNIGTILRDQGDLAGARPHLERALRIFQKFLGDDHPNTQTVRRNLERLGG